MQADNAAVGRWWCGEAEGWWWPRWWLLGALPQIPAAPDKGLPTWPAKAPQGEQKGAPVSIFYIQ